MNDFMFSQNLEWNTHATLSDLSLFYGMAQDTDCMNPFSPEESPPHETQDSQYSSPPIQQEDDNYTSGIEDVKEEPVKDICEIPVDEFEQLISVTSKRPLRIPVRPKTIKIPIIRGHRRRNYQQKRVCINPFNLATTPLRMTMSPRELPENSTYKKLMDRKENQYLKGFTPLRSGFNNITVKVVNKVKTIDPLGTRDREIQVLTELVAASRQSGVVPASPPARVNTNNNNQKEEEGITVPIPEFSLIPDQCYLELNYLDFVELIALEHDTCRLQHIINCIEAQRPEIMERLQRAISVCNLEMYNSIAQVYNRASNYISIAANKISYLQTLQTVDGVFVGCYVDSPLSSPSSSPSS